MKRTIVFLCVEGIFGASGMRNIRVGYMSVRDRVVGGCVNGEPAKPEAQSEPELEGRGVDGRRGPSSRILPYGIYKSQERPNIPVLLTGR